MKIYPAIDLQDGKVCRLLKGDFKSSITYPIEPMEAANSFARMGFSHLHVVDLDGARQGAPVHLGLLPRLASTGLSIRFGGGLRTLEDIELALRSGASMAMVGSLLFTSPDMPERIFRSFGDSIIPVVDSRDGFVAHSGWRSLSVISPAKAIEVLSRHGFRDFLVTSTERDGTLLGPDLGLYRSILRSGTFCSITAAGGISSLADLIMLREMGCSGCVIGKAFYEGTIDPVKALEVTGPC
ncbi:MAG TPA: 1-(5-phosphoribosyl)-5-[(5-phosphoribosylamino)methylideneamino] imidazole-4-carboxamide isomerase [Synergistales bacterium]|nr:1-(5-phosphoribosyl)-5-[(5-phosphoribosylamino)methylideneamino] imidazole-4-carboxamide isomerase [Synergistales bacterium]